MAPLRLGDSTVLVTGATGLVGAWLVKSLLKGGARVVVLVRDADPQSELLRSGDLARCSVVNGALEEIGTLERALAENEPEVVFHLGAQTQVVAGRRDPYGTLESNVRGTYTLLEACRRQRGPLRALVVASSDKAYGDAKELPYDEEMPLLGRFPYDASKVCTEVLARSYAESYGLPVVIARCGNVFGGGDLNWARVVPGTIRSLLRGERPIVRSDGTLIRDYVYVEDVVGAYRVLAERIDDDGVRGEAFNFSSERPLSVLQMVDAVAEAVGTRLPPDVRGLASHEIREQHLSAAKARARLGWSAAWTTGAALEKTVAWYRSFLGAPA